MASKNHEQNSIQSILIKITQQNTKWLTKKLINLVQTLLLLKKSQFQDDWIPITVDARALSYHNGDVAKKPASYCFYLPK